MGVCVGNGWREGDGGNLEMKETMQSVGWMHILGEGVTLEKEERKELAQKKMKGMQTVQLH